MTRTYPEPGCPRCGLVVTCPVCLERIRGAAERKLALAERVITALKAFHHNSPDEDEQFAALDAALAAWDRDGGRVP